MVGVTVSVVTCVCVCYSCSTASCWLYRDSLQALVVALLLMQFLILLVTSSENYQSITTWRRSVYCTLSSSQSSHVWLISGSSFSVCLVFMPLVLISCVNRYVGKTGRASSASWSNKFVSCDILLQISASVTRKLSVLDSDKQDFVGRDGSLMKCCYILYKLMYTLGRLVCRWQHHCVFHYFEFSLITWDKFRTDWSLGPKLIGTHSLILHWQNSLNC